MFYELYVATCKVGDNTDNCNTHVVKWLSRSCESYAENVSLIGLASVTVPSKSYNGSLPELQLNQSSR